MVPKSKGNSFLGKFFIIGLLVLYSGIALGQDTSPGVVKLKIDPDQGRGGTTSEFFDEVRFIPLETTKESTFGRIYKLEVTEKYFIIYDAETYCVLIFERNGKFHAKIKKRKPDEYFGVFTLNRSDNEIILETDNKVLVYDYNAKFLREEIIPLNVGGSFFFDRDHIAYHLNKPLTFSDAPSVKYDLVYSKGYNDVHKSLLPYDNRYVKYDYNLSEYLFSPQYDNSCFLVMPYSYNLFHLDSSGIIQTYQLNFPIKYSLPNDFEMGSAFAGKRKEYIFGNNTANGLKIRQIAPVFKSGDYLIFHLEKISGYFTYQDDMLYSLKTNTLYSLNRIAGDRVSDDITVLDSHFLENMLYVDKEYLYTSIPAGTLFEIKKKNAKTVYGEPLKRLFEKGSPDDNMVIIESKLKPGL